MLCQASSCAAAPAAPGDEDIVIQAKRNGFSRSARRRDDRRRHAVGSPQASKHRQKKQRRTPACRRWFFHPSFGRVTVRRAVRHRPDDGRRRIADRGTPESRNRRSARQHSTATRQERSSQVAPVIDPLFVFAHQGADRAIRILHFNGRVDPAQELDEQREGARQTQAAPRARRRGAPRRIGDRNHAHRKMKSLSNEFVPQLDGSANSVRDAPAPRGFERDRAAVRQPPVPELLLFGEHELLLDVRDTPRSPSGVGSSDPPSHPARRSGRLAKPEQHLAAIGHPARDPLFAKTRVRFVETKEIVVQRLCTLRSARRFPSRSRPGCRPEFRCRVAQRLESRAA